MGDLLIVGIDPGNTIGFAVLDTDKNIIDIGSSRVLNFNKLVSDLTSLGNILLVGCDKKKKPSFVEKFAIKTGAKLVCPDEDLLIKEKIELTKEYTYIKDHQRDALAAALFVHSQYEKLFFKVDYHLKDFDSKLRDKVLELCIKDGLNISLALDILTKPEKEEIIEIKKIINKDDIKNDLFFLYESLRKKEKTVSLLRKQNKRLVKEIRKIKEKDHYLKNKINKINSKEKKEELLDFKEKRINYMDKEIMIKDETISYLQEEVKKTYDFFTDLSENHLVKKLKNLGYEEFQKKNKFLKIQEDDILFVDDLDISNEKVLETLRNKINIIIYKKNKHKRIKGFILINYKQLKIKDDKYFALINKKDLDKQKNNIELIGDIISDYKKERNQIK